MRIIRLSLAGVAVQAISLALFAIVSRTRATAIGKPSVYGLALVGIVFVIWRAVIGRTGWISLCLLPLLLGFGYIAAWHLVGAIWFKGLLWDVYAPSWDYVWLEIDIACLLAGAYGILTAVLFGVHKVLSERAHRVH